ncbi:MAG: radical SAM protein, partial [Lachnospiraceae bacterium]
MSAPFEPACRRTEWLDPFYKAVWEKAFAEAIPISGTFELTPRCNFDCRMCYVHLKDEQIPEYGTELTAKEWLRIAREAKDAGTTWLCVTGGEPLLHPEFETIWKELAQMGFFITLQTNASVIRGKTAELLAQYPPKGVKVTLYGSNDEVYEKVCRVKWGFTRVDEGLRTLREMNIPVQLVSTIIRQNEDDVEKMAFYAYRNNLPWMATGSVKASARVADSEAREVRVQEKLDGQQRERIRRSLEKTPFDTERKPCTYCKDYRLGYWVTWNGEMRFCSFMNEPNIPVRDLAFSEAWRQLVQYE